jgi:hypothetical protein
VSDGEYLVLLNTSYIFSIFSAFHSPLLLVFLFFFGLISMTSSDPLCLLSSSGLSYGIISLLFSCVSE